MTAAGHLGPGRGSGRGGGGHGSGGPAGRAGAGDHIGVSARARARARAESQRRHPTARAWRPDRRRVLERLAQRASLGGARWPRVAAAVVMLRGIAGDDAPAFADRLGIGVATLDRLEGGLSPPSAIPVRLRAVTGLVDWAWVDHGFW
jgi:hypothetical protein